MIMDGPAAMADRAPGPATEPWTRREILQQPATLAATQALLAGAQGSIDAFLAPLLARPDLRIILAGAGTSAFIGDSLAPGLSRRLGRTVEAIPTTDLVSAPGLWLRADAPSLLVSFGRSGSSPESLAAADLVDAMVDEVHHLVITCNAAGALARRPVASGQVVVLPDATHDRGFAMTSSFSAMMLAALSIFSGIGSFDARAEAIARSVEAALSTEARAMTLAAQNFERVVYLGSGPLKGLAREAALKLLELSDGRIVTMFDSTLGFRHGPKTIVDPRTLVMMFVANDPLTRAYDLDMLAELRADNRCGGLVAIAAGSLGDLPGRPDDIAIDGLDRAADDDLMFPMIVPAQLFAYHASLRLGLTPDQPNASGTVNRVVQGVRIHPAIG